MKSGFYVIVLAVFFVHPLQLAAQETLLWEKDNERSSSSRFATQTRGEQQVYALKSKQLSVALNAVSDHYGTEVVFPQANGKLTTFSIKKSSVFHPDLAKKFPNIANYIGIDNESKNIRLYLSKTVFGIHAMIVSPEYGTTFIEPAIDDKNTYSVFKREVAINKTPFTCLVENMEQGAKTLVNKSANADDLKLRTYRLAIATTEEYSNFHVDAAGLGPGAARNDSINAVMSAIAVTMTRVNAIFENDLAITMELVPNNDQLIFLESDPGSDPYNNDNGSVMLNQNQTTIDNIIGTANYDLGHVFSTGGGGVANLASVCTSAKAKGVTGSGSPVGEAFYLDYVAHEMGHQFGANHTFNGTNANCTGNRNNATAVEPGSGTTLMSYAGICGPDNVQNMSDGYFHKVSIAEIMSNVTNGAGQCATATNFVNNLHLPVINAGADYTIPKSTPFALVGQATDADGNMLTYCWEQIDNEVSGIQIPPSTTQTQGAVFRSYPPSTSPIRNFPSLDVQLYGGSNEIWEVLPSVARDMDFALTVRDNVPGEGQTVSDEIKVTVNDAAGPFVVTSQNASNVNWEVGTNETITWDVAGTDTNGINVGNVNILLSVDGGLNFDTILASNTPNDGSEVIVVPNVQGYEARVLVAAASNIFYNINEEPFSIGDFTTTCTTYAATDVPKNIPDNNPSGIVSSLQINDNITISDIEVSLNISHTWLWDLQVILKSPSGTEVIIYDRSCGSSNLARRDIDAVFDDDAPGMVCNNTIPAITGISLPAQLLSAFKNEDANGTWDLKVIDYSGGDTGTLNNWSLKLCETKQTVSTDEFELADFNMFPNPAQDDVNITFRSDTLNSVSISVYDLSGRRIKRTVFNEVNPVFEENINIRSLTPGVYIVQVKSGKAAVNRKLIKF